MKARMWLKASAVIVMLSKMFWVFTRHFLVRNQRFGTNCLYHILGLEMNKTLKMGQTSSPETLISYQKTTPGKNPEDLIQHITQVKINMPHTMRVHTVVKHSTVTSNYIILPSNCVYSPCANKLCQMEERQMSHMRLYLISWPISRSSVQYIYARLWFQVQKYWFEHQCRSNGFITSSYPNTLSQILLIPIPNHLLL
jgi:hypothetical protein